MTETLIIGGYLIGALGTIRFFVLLNALRWPDLRWDDTGFALFFGALWPIYIWMILCSMYRYYHPTKPGKGWLAKWHAADVEKHRHD